MSLWPALERFLRTDPRDAGCERTIGLLDVYAELVVAHQGAAERHPDIAAHLRACEACHEDFTGLLAAIA